MNSNFLDHLQRAIRSVKFFNARGLHYVQNISHSHEPTHTDEGKNHFINKHWYYGTYQVFLCIVTNTLFSFLTEFTGKKIVKWRSQYGRLARWIKRRASNVGEAKERLENELWRKWSNRRVGEWAVTYVKRRKGWRMSSAHSPTFPSLHVRHNSLSNPSVALPMSQLILQPFCCFTYVTVHSPTLLSLLLRHKLFT